MIAPEPNIETYGPGALRGATADMTPEMLYEVALRNELDAMLLRARTEPENGHLAYRARCLCEQLMGLELDEYLAAQ